MAKSAERLAAIEAERRAIEAARAEVRLAALDAEAARIREAEAWCAGRLAEVSEPVRWFTGVLSKR